MSILNTIWSSVVFHLLLFALILLWWLVVLPIFVRIKYSVLFKKLKNLDEQLKWKREGMDPVDVIHTKMEWSNLRYHLGIGIDVDLLLVRPPTIQSIIMEAWLELKWKKEALPVFLLFFLIDTAALLLF